MCLLDLHMKNRNIGKTKPFLKTGRKYFSYDIRSKHALVMCFSLKEFS